MTAKALGFDGPTRNSLDSVASRDFAAEFLFACAMCAKHLSRFAEEIVIWTNPYFGFVKLSDAYTTGSLEKGATPDQMTEAVHVAAAIRGGASLVHAVQMRNKIDKIGM